MRIKVGTFNLNNLFSRFNFKGQIKSIKDGNNQVIKTFEFSDSNNYTIKFAGSQLVEAKPGADRAQVAKRILDMDLDVLAVQEVEDIDTLELFNQEDLKGKYPYRVLVEGNDSTRLIDVGLLSKLPVGAVTSWRHAIHEDEPDRPVFSRDLLEVEILDPSTRQKLLTVFNNHLKSQFVQLGQNPQKAKAEADQKRRMQAETAAEIIQFRMQADSAYLVMGDMNDGPDSDCLKPLTSHPKLSLVNGMVDPNETQPAKADNPLPATKAWSHRYKEGGKPAQYVLFDQIWLSRALGPHLKAAWINRRSKHAGDGSDHDPVWVELEV